MKPIHYIIALFIAAAFGLAVSGSHPVQGTAGYTGAPGDSFCSQCHNASGSLNGTVEISGLPSEITPGNTYTLTVTLTNTLGTAAKGGFQMLVLNGNDMNSGTFSNNSPMTSIKTVSGGRKYVGHEPAPNFPGSGVLTWEVDWTAPATAATGQAKFYVAGLFGNNSGNQNGDRAVSSNVFVPFEASSPDPISLTITNVINPSCHNTIDGSATVNITGGTPPYNILWNNGETTPIANALPPGLAVVTVTDAGAGNSSKSVTLIAPQPISITLNTTGVSCFGSSDGTATAGASGGTGNKTFFWSNGGFGSSQNNLAAGSYTVTASDANGCEEVESFDILSPDQILINVIDILNPSCFGQNNGFIMVEAEGGAGGFNYSWSNGGGGPNLTNLASGTYTVTVTDISNCTSNTSYTLMQPSQVAIQFPSVNHVTCFGETNGAVTALATGGNGNFTYEWSNGNSGASIQNLAPGSYTVTVIDVEGCVASSAVTINEPLPIQIQLVTNTPASCSGANDGVLEVEAFGSSTQFSFLWSNGATTALNGSISAGTYTVTVTDVNLCSETASYVVNTTAPFVLSLANSTNNLCFGDALGTVSVNVQPPGAYVYSWSNGATGQSLSNLPNGSYTCTATDDSGCASAPVTVMITSPPLLVSNLSIVNEIACFADSTGELSVLPSGGFGNYDILWSNLSTEDTISDLPPATYFVRVSDENNCVMVDTVVLNQPPPLQINLLTIDTLLCFSDDDGMIEISIGGGTGNIHIEWNTGDSTTIINDLSAGTYSIMIEDENECSKMESFVIIQPASIDVQPTITKVTPDNGNDGSISVIVSGGNSPYQFLWSNGDTTNAIDSLSIGTYRLTITDANDCIKTVQYVVSLLDCPLSVEVETSDATCFGGDDGQMNVKVFNPLGSYTTVLTINNMIVLPPYNNLSAGMYTLEVVDSAFCRIELDSILIEQPSNIVVIDSITHPTTGQNNGMIDLMVSGGTPGYTYTWFNASGQKIGETSRIENLGQGFYRVDIIDSLGCLRSKNYILQDRVSLQEEEIEFGINLFPNPSNGYFTIETSKPMYWSKVILRNTTGQTLANFKIDHVQSSYMINTDNMSAGLIFVEVQFLNQSLFHKVFIHQ
ncbi:MAG: choice-of-anchor V domain-containing protein [Saprospiraceae bacterium]